MVHKMSNGGTKFRQFHYYNHELTEISPECLYVLSGQENGAVFDKKGPRHVIATGNIPSGLTERMDILDTLIHIPGPISTSALLQAGYTIFSSYEAWHDALLMALIQRKPIGAFLKIASEKLTNPLALFDNNMAVISTAGEFLFSVKGTIWEQIDNPSFVPTDFFTHGEQRELSKYASKKDGCPYVYHASADPDHTYASSHIWIDDKLYGSIGMVDINAPFTDGQLFIIREITHTLKLYFQNNSIYMRMVENKLNYLDSLLEGAEISAEIVSRYLDRIKWKLDDEFCFLTFTCSVDLTVPIASVSYIKQLNGLFPQTLISVYRDSIIMIIRYADYPVRCGRNRQQLERLLEKNEMHCGVSIVFNDFMRLRCYYIQSSFAAACCKPRPDTLIFFMKAASVIMCCILLLPQRICALSVTPRFLPCGKAAKKANRNWYDACITTF
ncbi:MAG: hypothetical protein LBF75_11815 [Treponema sp.]|nr:hypothetical protein [Treponema sp.]